MRKPPTLLTPGPTPIPPAVLDVLARPPLHHRTPEFEAAFLELRTLLKRFFGTSQEVIPLACTGTGAMEACLVNLFSPGDSVLVLDTGKFGERWGKLAAAFGLQPIVLKGERGAPVSLLKVEENLKSHPEVRALLFPASETSTGLKLPTQELAALARRYQILSVCDAITALGVFELPMDAWGLDAVITGSQKALMLPPGLAFVAFSERAWQAQAVARLPRFYFDLGRERKNVLKNQTAWSPATSLLLGARESLRIILEESLEVRFQRHARWARATRAGVTRLGLSVLASQSPSEAVTAALLPLPVEEGRKVPRRMAENHGCIVMGGQDELEGRIVRLSHFGHLEDSAILHGIEALGNTLQELGMRDLPVLEAVSETRAALRS
jgi:aspartate aminotransferase-like enzyme